MAKSPLDLRMDEVQARMAKDRLEFAQLAFAKEFASPLLNDPDCDAIEVTHLPTAAWSLHSTRDGRTKRVFTAEVGLRVDIVSALNTIFANLPRDGFSGKVGPRGTLVVTVVRKGKLATMTCADLSGRSLDFDFPPED